MFKCPYCLLPEISGKVFTSWEQVSNHSRFCKNKTKEYHISAKYGPIHYSELLQNSSKDKYPLLNRSQVVADFKKSGLIPKDFRLVKKITKQEVLQDIRRFVTEFGRVPTTKDFAANKNYPSDSTVKRLFDTWNNAIVEAGFKITVTGHREGKISFSKEQVIGYISSYYEQYHKIPSYEDFYAIAGGPKDFHIRKYFGNYTNLVTLVFSEEQQNYWSKELIAHTILDFYSKYSEIHSADCISSNKLPSIKTITKYYGTFNKMLLELDIPIKIIDGCYGIHTLSKDGHTYRSKAEAYFVDNYLYSKYNYIIEPKYPEPYSRIYDWYLSDLDLYIELDGGCRPSVIEEKIKINKLIGHNLLVVPIRLITKYSNLEDVINIINKG